MSRETAATEAAFVIVFNAYLLLRTSSEFKLYKQKLTQYMV